MNNPTVSEPNPKTIALYWVVLLGSGTAWGSTQYFSKVAVSTGHPALGIVVWQSVIGAGILLAALVASGRRLPFERGYLMFYAVCGFLGTAFPHTLGYTSIKHLPIGIASILITTVPMMTLGLSFAVGADRADGKRVIGILLGLVAVLLILIPEASLPEDGQWIWALFPLAAAFAYSCENVYIAKYQPAGCDALQTMAGLTIAALIMVTPITWAEGTWVDLSPLGAPEQAIIAAAGFHVVAYFGFVWLIGKAGPI
ncbi:MAG: DMT family transporter, partial [Pseudomonadota bacterium]